MTCRHLGPVRDYWDETVCGICDRRFASMEHLAADGGWNLADGQSCPICRGTGWKDACCGAVRDTGDACPDCCLNAEQIPCDCQGDA